VHTFKATSTGEADVGAKGVGGLVEAQGRGGGGAGGVRSVMHDALLKLRARERQGMLPRGAR